MKIIPTIFGVLLVCHSSCCKNYLKNSDNSSNNSINEVPFNVTSINESKENKTTILERKQDPIIQKGNSSSSTNLYEKIKKFKLNKYEKYTDYIIYDKCDDNRCPSNRGKCILDNICKCNIGYMTVSSMILDETDPFCNYVQKHKSHAILLEILFPGLGYYHIGNTGYSYTKIIFITFFVLFSIIPRTLRYYKKNDKQNNDDNHVLINVITFYGLNVIDMIYFCLFYYYDGNSIPLQA